MGVFIILGFNPLTETAKYWSRNLQSELLEDFLFLSLSY